MVVQRVDFRLPGPEYEAITWVHNEHMPGSAALLERSVQNPRTQPDGLPGQIYINGYSFSRDWQMGAAPGPFDLAMVTTWQERLFPGIEEARLAFDTFDPAAVQPGGWREALTALEAQYWQVFLLVHRETMGQVLPASARWMELHAERFGAERRDDALALLAGFANTSTARSASLWDLSRIAARDSDVRAAIEAGRLHEGGSEAARAFRDGVASLIELYGDTTTMHLLDLPTWREDATIPLEMVAAMLGEADERDPRQNEERSIARRLQLEAELAHVDIDEEMRNVLAVAQYLAPVSEDHNLFCDQRLIAASRRRWLRVGAHLVTRNLLEAPDDVFHLSFEELLGALERDEVVATSLIARRRERQAQWRAVTPPTRIGGETATADEAIVLLRGTAGSAGVYRGRARIVPSLEAAGVLEAGDVLVCAATAPEWTPYFGVIGALVTGSGGVLTHGAVVAREYGLPAVVGLQGATSRIPDGAFVIVDGSAGTVTLERE
jgi:pyruvate,water dikinase